MTTTFANAPYVLLPGANGNKPAASVQLNVDLIQTMLTGGVIDKWDSPAEVIKNRQTTYEANIQYLKNLTSTKTYEGFIDKPLISSYVQYAESVFNAKNFTIPADVYGKAMVYNEATGGFKPVETPVSNVVAPLAQNYVPTNVVPTYTVTYLDPSVTVTEGQDIMVRAKLNTNNHNGVTFRNNFGSVGNQFWQSDVVGAETRSNYLFPEFKFAAGSDYAEIRVGTVDDTLKESDESANLSGGFTLSQEYKLNFAGSTLITIADNDWGPTVSNVTNNVNNISIVGNNNNVNITNNTTVAINAVINGTSGNDELIGTDDAETIKGGYGADVLKGGLGDDILIGNQDNDQLFGGEGADVLWGGYGDDLICPNQGNDISYGNAGADRFILCKGQDTIKDFNFAEGDRLLVFGDTASVSYGMSTAGNFEVRRGTDVTTLEGVTFATFDPTKAVLAMG